VTVDEEFIITPIEIPEKSTSSQEGPEVTTEVKEGSQKGPDTSVEGSQEESE
jgi:hypothetical protein